jgi:hypothetical protein
MGKFKTAVFGRIISLKKFSFSKLCNSEDLATKLKFDLKLLKN